MKSVEEIKALILPSVEKHHCELYDVIFEKEGNDLFLRIFIDQVNGLDMDTCAIVSEEVNQILDSTNAITEVDYVEVSSPGIEKTIRNQDEMNQAVNQYIFVQFNEPIKNYEEVYGTLIDHDDHQYTIQFFDKGVKKKLIFNYAQIAYVRHAVKF